MLTGTSDHIPVQLDKYEFSLVCVCLQGGWLRNVKKICDGQGRQGWTNFYQEKNIIPKLTFTFKSYDKSRWQVARNRISAN